MGQRDEVSRNARIDLRRARPRCRGGFRLWLRPGFGLKLSHGRGGPVGPLAPTLDRIPIAFPEPVRTGGVDGPVTQDGLRDSFGGNGLADRLIGDAAMLGVCAAREADLELYGCGPWLLRADLVDRPPPRRKGVRTPFFRWHMERPGVP